MKKESRRTPPVWGKSWKASAGFATGRESSGTLRCAGTVSYTHLGDDGLISLTDKGRSIAESVYERHTLFTQWLVSLGVDQTIAAQDACRIEHVLSKETFEAIKRHVESGMSSPSR